MCMHVYPQPFWAHFISVCFTFYNSIHNSMADLAAGKWLHEPVFLYRDAAGYWCCPANLQGLHGFPWIYLRDLHTATPPPSQDVAAPAQQAMSHAHVAQASATQSGYLVGASDSDALGRDRRCGLSAGRVGQCQPPPLPHQPPHPVQVPHIRLLRQHPQPALHRPQHPHPMFEDGTFRQQQIYWNSQPSDLRTRMCRHPQLNWTGALWWNPSRFGTHCGVIDMSDPAVRRTFADAFFSDMGCHLPFSILDHALQGSLGSITWCKIHTEAGYSGVQALCKHCGACSFGAWRADSTPAWIDHQRANIMHFVGCHVHAKLTAPLEMTLPMV